MDIKNIYFLVCVLYSLNKEHKDKFSELLDRRIIDRALYRANRDKVTPEWFAQEFHFDALYSHLHGLRDCLTEACVMLGLIRLDGTHCKYHLDEANACTLAKLAADESICMTEVRNVANKLDLIIDTLLNEKGIRTGSM